MADAHADSARKCPVNGAHVLSSRETGLSPQFVLVIRARNAATNVPHEIAGIPIVLSPDARRAARPSEKVREGRELTIGMKPFPYDQEHIL